MNFFKSNMATHEAIVNLLNKIGPLDKHESI